MAKSMSTEEIDRLARRRAGAKLGWYVHATVYLLVNAALGWGLGLVLHGLAVFVLGTGSGLRESMVQKERERLQRQQREP